MPPGSHTKPGTSRGFLLSAEAPQRVGAVAELESIIAELDHIEVTAELAHAAGELAQRHGLRGYDAVRLAAAVAADDSDLLLATGDADLAAAATSLGLAVVVVNA